MAKEPKYYELYGEIVRSNIFLKRLVLVLVVVNLGLGYLSFRGFTRPAQTYVIKDGYAYSTEPVEDKRSPHEVRRFAYEFAKKFLEFNRENFNDRFRAALKMCTTELEYYLYNGITGSEIPRIVQNTKGNIKFEINEIQVQEGDPFNVTVTGEQIFPGASTVPIQFSLEIVAVPRTQDNPFGLRIINYIQGKE